MSRGVGAEQTVGLLEALSELSEVRDGLSDEAHIEEEYSGTVVVSEDTVVTADDSVRERTFPVSDYREKVGLLPTIDDRFDHAESAASSGSVTSIQHGQEAEVCSKCDGDTRITCPACDGEEEWVCRECDGDKRVSCPNSDCRFGDVECSSCGGRGHDECPECDAGRVPCSTCDGGGEVPRYEERQCPRCTGRSVIECDECNDDEDCSNCGGEFLLDCPRCDGDGTLEQESGTETCPDCAGDGEEDCGNCDGSGKVDVCSECGGNGTVDCSECGGLGDILCPNCDGDVMVTCGRCSGGGDVVCTRCDGDAETVTAEFGELDFSSDTGLEVRDGRYPGQFFDARDAKTHGELEEQETLVDGQLPDRNSSATFRHHRDTYEVPVEYVRYAVDGGTYEAARVGGDLRYDDFPPSLDSLEERAVTVQDADFFGYDPGDSGLAGVVTRTTLTAVAAVLSAVVAVVVALVVAVFSIAVQLPGDAILIGAGVLAAYTLSVIYAGTFGDHSPSGAASAKRVEGIALGVQLALVGAAGALVVTGTGGLATRLALLTLTASAWALVVGDLLRYEAARIEDWASKFEELPDVMAGTSNHGILSRSSMDLDHDTLERYDIIDRFPGRGTVLAPGTLTRVALAVTVVGWGLGGFYLGAVLLSSVLGSPLLLGEVTRRTAFLLAVAPLGVGLIGALVFAAGRLLASGDDHGSEVGL